MTGSALPPLTGSTARPLQPDDPRSLGAYQVIGRLGQGGMGTVFLGRAPDGSAVAIKVIRPELAQRAEFRARFAREAESARRVRRFTTAAVLDADPHGQQPYLVTEFVEGPTLSRHVSIRGPLRPADLEQLAVSTTTALSAIHAAGIVHRDLTPGNVLLSPVGPKVIDFGLAREFNADTELSRNVRQAIGTPGYMSPEQILDAPITSAVDIFSWGAVMIFAATGQPPFGTGRMEAILYRIINEPPKLDSLNPELRELVEAAMAKDPAARPSAEELRSALIAGGPVPVHPLGPPGEPATTPGSAGDPAAEPEPARRRWGRRGRADAPTGASTPPVTPVPLAGPADSADSASPATPVATESSAAWAAQSSAMPQTQLSPPPIASPPPVAPPPPLRQGPSAHGSPPPIGPTAPAGSAHPTGSSPAIGSPAPGSSPVPGGAYPPAGAPVGSSPAGGPSTSAGAPPVDPEPASPPRRRRRALMFGGGLAVLLAVAVAVPVVVLGGGGGHDGEPSAAERTRVSTRLAASAAVERARNPQLAARLSLAAYAVAPTAPARDALVLSFARSTASSVEPGGTTYTDLALSPDGRALAGTDEAGRLHLWRLTDGQRSTVASQPSQSDQASGVVFAADGRTLVTGGTDNAGRLWDVTDPDRPRPLGALGSQAATVRQLALSSTAHLLATAGGDSSVGLWDITDPSRPQPRFLLTGRGPVTDVALRPDGAVLAVAGVGGSVQLWNVRDPADPSQLGSVAGHTGAVNTIAFSPDGTQLATGGDDQVVQLADVHDPAHPGVARRLTGHHNAVTTVAYTGADRLLSADTAGTVAYWDLDGTGAAGKASSPSFTRIGALDGPVRAIGTTSAGTVAATTGKGQTFVGTLDPARLRRLACATPSVAPERAEWNREAPTIPYTDVCAP